MYAVGWRRKTDDNDCMIFGSTLHALRVSKAEFLRRKNMKMADPSDEEQR